MKLADERCDSELEAGAPLVDALLGFVEALDELQERMLVTFQELPPQVGRVRCRFPVSAAGGSGDGESRCRP